MPPSGDGSRAAFFYINTHNFERQRLYTITALTLHETVPGHHIQIALQQ
jgi:prolyl oligopeptidase